MNLTEQEKVELLFKKLEDTLMYVPENIRKINRNRPIKDELDLDSLSALELMYLLEDDDFPYKMELDVDQLDKISFNDIIKEMN